MFVQTAGAEEHARAAKRAGTKLVADRTVRPETRTRRDQLIGAFSDWLVQTTGHDVTFLVDRKSADVEEVSAQLVEYGKQMFYAGKSYGRYAETINAVAQRRPLFKKQLTKAWDLAFAWVADEPHAHHPAMPASILVSLVTIALLWGWPREAAIIMMTWTGVMRIGEVLNAKRKDLVLPQDCPPGMTYALLHIGQPKTRGVGPRHQSARIDPSDAVSLLAATFGRLGKNDKLWENSPQLLRKRFNLLQQALGLPTTRSKDVVPYSLASLRAGGATHLLQRFEDAEFVRRRGRWLSSRVCEIYLQEITFATHSQTLTAETKQRIEKLLGSYNVVLERSIFFLNSFIPPIAWTRLW